MACQRLWNTCAVLMTSGSAVVTVGGTLAVLRWVGLALEPVVEQVAMLIGALAGAGFGAALVAGRTDE